VLFTFPSRYLFTIGRKWVFSLGRWSSLLPTGLAWPVVLWMCQSAVRVSHTRLSLPVAPLSSGVLLPLCSTCPSVVRLDTPYNPIHATATALYTCTVWALPCSLAATWGIEISFFSSGYLDVSVHPVNFPCLCVQHGIPQVRLRWVPPFGYPRIKARLQLPGAFRRWLRPSSPPYAKASTVCPS
jgi:hypothetical protein